MKNSIKLFSVLALAALTVNTLAPVVASAEVVNSPAESDASVTFVLDEDTDAPVVHPRDPEDEFEPTLPPAPISSLAITHVPAGFDFGTHAISAAMQAQAGSTTFNIDPAGIANENEFVSVWDGRIVEEGWFLQAGLSAFVGGADTLAGAEIEIANVVAGNLDGIAGRSNVAGSSNILLEAGGSAVTVLSAAPNARMQSDLLWDLEEDVMLHVPYASLTTEAFEATITWTLTAGPEA